MAKRKEIQVKRFDITVKQIVFPRLWWVDAAAHSSTCCARPRDPLGCVHVRCTSTAADSCRCTRSFRDSTGEAFCAEICFVVHACLLAAHDYLVWVSVWNHNYAPLCAFDISTSLTDTAAERERVGNENVVLRPVSGVRPIVAI